MSRHQEMIESAYRETMEFLAERQRADGDGDRTDVTSVPEMTVEVDVRDAATAETRTADSH